MAALNRALPFILIVNLGKTKSARLVRKTVAHDRDRIDVDTMLRKPPRHITLSYFKRQIT